MFKIKDLRNKITITMTMMSPHSKDKKKLSAVHERKKDSYLSRSCFTYELVNKIFNEVVECYSQCLLLFLLLGNL